MSCYASTCLFLSSFFSILLSSEISSLENYYGGLRTCSGTLKLGTEEDYAGCCDNEVGLNTMSWGVLIFVVMSE